MKRIFIALLLLSIPLFLSFSVQNEDAYANTGADVQTVPKCLEVGLCPELSEEQKNTQCKPTDTVICGDEPLKNKKCTDAECKKSTPSKSTVKLPDFSVGGICTKADINAQLTSPYEYKANFSVKRIEGQTVPINSITKTTVVVSREDLSDYRTEISNFLKRDLQVFTQIVDDCTSKTSDLLTELESVTNNHVNLDNQLSECINNTDENVSCDNLLKQIEPVTKKLGELESDYSKANERLKALTQGKNYLIEYQKNMLSLNDQYKSLGVDVSLLVNDQSKDYQSVKLNEGSEQTISFDWKLEKDSLVAVVINSDKKYQACNNSFDICELSQKDNSKFLPVYISSGDVPNTCSKDGKTDVLQGIVKTIQEGHSLEDVQNLYEYVYTTLEIDSDEKNRKAGYGFYYKVLVDYKNEATIQNEPLNGTVAAQAVSFNPNQVSSHLPYVESKWVSPNTSSRNHSGITHHFEGFNVPLELTSVTTKNDASDGIIEQSIFELPEYSIEKFSGNVFEGSANDASLHVEHDLEDELLDAGRKWYLDFSQESGNYIFNVVLKDVGTNKLNPCVEGEIIVDGYPVGEDITEGSFDFILKVIKDVKDVSNLSDKWNWGSDLEIIEKLREWSKKVSLFLLPSEPNKFI